MAFNLMVLMQQLTLIQVILSTGIFVDNDRQLKVNDIPEGYSRERMEVIRSFILSIPPMKAHVVHPLMQLINTFTKSGSPEEQNQSNLSLMCLLVSASTNESLTHADCTEIFQPWFEETEDKPDLSSYSTGLTEEELKTIRDKLKDKIGIAKTEQLMRVLRKFHKDNAMIKYSQAFVDLLYNALFQPSTKPNVCQFKRVLVDLVKLQLDTELQKRA